MSDMTDTSALPQAPAARPRPFAREGIAILLFLGFALIPFAATLGAESYILSLVTRAMIFAIAALSLDLILGYGALVSFGHAAFLGIGAYAVGILASHGVTDAALQLPAALAASALFALITGALSLRAKGVYFIMITLAFGQMAFFFAISLAAYGGDDGLTLRSRSTLLGFSFIANDRAFYYVTLLLLIGSFILCRILVTSRFGRVIRGAKENPVRMEAVGYALYRFQLAMYVIAGTLCGLAGFLLANQAEFVSPAYMTWQRSGELIVMVVLGGLGSLHGAVLGAAAFLLLEEWLSGFTEHWKMIFGPFLVIVVLFARGGMLGALDKAPRLRDALVEGPGRLIARLTGRRHG
jgi:branched-chain amino acid transport system permease protein